ncbi:MAG: hypothetical protein ACRC33_26110 [Gemmataceae bacterium]
MIVIHLVGEGERDAVVLPALLERLLGVKVAARFTAWAEIEIQGKGFEKKLLYAVRRAISAKVRLLVATVDTDKDARNDKLGRLRAAAEKDGQCGSLVHVAFGEATPHSEAWLLDDAVAVRTGLGLAGDHPVPVVTKTKYPKDAIEELRDASPHAEAPILDVLSRIAQLVEHGRCVHSRDTGFDQFTRELAHAHKLSGVGCPPDCPCGDACPTA